MKLKFKNRTAVTLIELLIYLTITTIVLVVMIDLVTRIAQNRSASIGQTQVTQNARFLNDRLEVSIQSASVASGVYPSNTLNLTVDGSSVTFSLSNGQMFYQEGAGPANPLTESSVKIEPIDNGQIFEKITNGTAASIQIKFKVVFSQNNFSRDFQTTVLLRGI
ncbi:MAG: hypothetical protein HW405_460 [Candidatus Berkelbacteria bacterium]|nr:hypothetical protein [Candidatus Berkelbacteria bacterium]